MGNYVRHCNTTKNNSVSNAEPKNKVCILRRITGKVIDTRN